MDFKSKQIPYARHYKPRLVYFFTPFPKTIYLLWPLALCMACIQERLLIKSGLWWRAYGSCHFHIGVWDGLGIVGGSGIGLWPDLAWSPWCRAHPIQHIGDWHNSLDYTDLNQCGARRDAELCCLCYKQNGSRWVMIYHFFVLGLGLMRGSFGHGCGLLVLV